MRNLNQIISELRGSMESVLPDGCPFVIGGGLIRDAFYGGYPGDIDVWLPSNITIPDADAFARHIATHGYGRDDGFQGQILFRGPGSQVAEDRPEGVFGFEATPPTPENYGDVHNHWVMELENTSEERGYPKVNIMRNMAVWNNDAPAWFTTIMRNFDLDCCMFFVGYMRGQRDVNTVIIPRHIVQNLSNRARGGISVHMNEVYWNQARVETTSHERIMSRVHKMNDKYEFRIPEDVNRIRMIPTDEIVAEPVTMSWLLRFFNSGGGYGVHPLPTRTNRWTPAQHRERLARAQARFEEYRAQIAARGQMHPQHVNAMTFYPYW